MSIRGIRQSFLRSLGNVVLGAAVPALCSSLKLEVINEGPVNEMINGGQSFVVAFWHGSMLYPWYYFRNRKLQALISQSKDGELLARILKKWKYQVVRGSSSKGGRVALGVMVDLLKHEGAVAITPDGPRGPIHEFKPGAVIAAQRAQVPLVLLGAGYMKQTQLKSWDRFSVPKPFSKVRLVFSDPLIVPADANRQQVAEIIQHNSEAMRKLQSLAEQF